jgi:hypothetical protein
MLISAPDVPGEIKGVTTLDTEAILRARSELSKPRGNRILSFITGEIPVEAEAPADPASLARPDLAVRREMLRLQIEAETADLRAESIALKADELARLGIPLSALGNPPPAVDGETPPGSDVPHQAADPTQAGIAPQAADTTRPDAPAPADDPAGGGEWPSELDPEAGRGAPSQG